MPPEELTNGVVISRLPARHVIEAGPATIPVRADAAALRALTGTRVTDDPLAFAIAAAAATGAKTMPDPVPSKGEALASWAEGHAEKVDAGDARLGDLLVFDRAVGGEPASLWAVAIDRDARGVVEMIYVGGGVIRRGFVDPALPHVARDAKKRVHNTFLRHTKDWPPKGTRYLAGELLADAYRLR